ncbi:hypothetical protein F4809DRAFT_590270 [Biscogniauxia mediterranea]|nr:hypothetical protein F4809DRAFT_590270 [Biscogniauxia mediterranea]
MYVPSVLPVLLLSLNPHMNLAGDLNAHPGNKISCLSALQVISRSNNPLRGLRAPRFRCASLRDVGETEKTRRSGSCAIV